MPCWRTAVTRRSYRSPLGGAGGWAPGTSERRAPRAPGTSRRLGRRPSPSARGRACRRARRPARGRQVAAMSSQPPHVPTARPARNAAPSVVASFTGRHLDRPLGGVGECLHEGGVVGHPAVDAQRGDREAGVRLGGVDEVGAALGHALEHGPHDLRPLAAAGEAEQRAAGAVVPARGAEAEQSGHVDDAVGSSRSGWPRRGSRRRVAMMPRSSRSHSTLVPAESITASTPQVVVAVPAPRHDREAAAVALALEPGALLAEVEVEHAAGAEGDLGQPRPHAALADQARLLVADERRDRRRAVERGGLADDARACRPPSGRMRAGDAERVEDLVVPVACRRRA